MKITIMLSLVAVIFVMACNNVVHEKNNVLGQFTENPVTITWDGNKEEGVQAIRQMFRYLP